MILSLKELTILEGKIDDVVEQYVEVQSRDRDNKKVDLKLRITDELEVRQVTEMAEVILESEVDLQELMVELGKKAKNMFTLGMFILEKKELLFDLLGAYFNAPRYIFERMGIMTFGSLVFTLYKKYESFFMEMKEAMTEKTAS